MSKDDCKGKRKFHELDKASFHPLVESKMQESDASSVESDTAFRNKYDGGHAGSTVFAPNSTEDISPSDINPNNFIDVKGKGAPPLLSAIGELYLNGDAQDKEPTATKHTSNCQKHRNPTLKEYSRGVSGYCQPADMPSQRTAKVSQAFVKTGVVHDDSDATSRATTDS